MMLRTKILAFVLLLLIFQIGIAGLFGSMSHAADATVTSSRVKSYTTQNINVNKKRPVHLSQMSLIERPLLPPPMEVLDIPSMDKVQENLETTQDPVIYLPQQPQTSPETIVLEKLQEQSALEPAADISVSDKEYVLGAEDKIKIIVFGEKDLSGEYKIGGDGIIAMPLIGAINVQDMSLRQAEQTIEAKLRDGYLKKPSVSIEVQESRPFYIMGEVGRPGSYHYINGMSVLQAIAISGGYTYRANRKTVDIIRGKTGSQKPVSVSPEEKVHAGDIIFVRESFF